MYYIHIMQHAKKNFEAHKTNRFEFFAIPLKQRFCGGRLRLMIIYISGLREDGGAVVDTYNIVW